MKNTKQQDFDKSSEYIKNEIRFKLLACLPSFQGDVRAVRKELDLPQEGFSYGKELQKWYDEKLIKKSDEISNSKIYIQKIREASNFQWKNHAEYLKIKWEAEDLIPINKIRNRQIMLGEKYKLPANFYDNNHPFYGLYPYILTGKIVAPSNNWVIEPDPKTRVGTAKWLSIKTYAPLSRKEFAEATKMLKSMQKHYFPKQITATNRIKKQFDRDLEIYRELVLRRKKKPVRTKEFEQGSYLYHLKKSGASHKIISKAERENPASILVEFDEMTSKKVAKKLGISSDAVRKSIERIRTLIEAFFPNEKADIKVNT